MELQWAAAVYAAPHTAWSASARMVMAAIVVLAISWRAVDSRWPVAAHEAAYRLSAAPLLIAAMAVWSLFVNFTHDGASDPLPYLPLVNALDLGHVLAIFAGLSWWLALRRKALAAPEPLRGRNGMTLFAVLVFVWLNAILLRSIHHWTGLPYLFSPMFASVTVQAALSIFWSVLALSLMLWATRGGRRAAWMVGAGLMAVVVVKLVLLDLSHLSGLTRILAFIVVGVLMLVIGYFSPVPPKTKEEAA
jgi:uncharacterized membrane protein